MLCIFFAYVTHIASDVYCAFLCVCCAYSLHVFFAYVTHHPCVWYAYSSHMLRIILVYGIYPYSSHMLCVWYMHSLHMLVLCIILVYDMRILHACCVYSSRILRVFFGREGGGCIPILELFYKIFLRCTFEMLIRTLIYISPKILVEHGVSIKYLLLLTLIMSFLEAMWRPWICWITK